MTLTLGPDYSYTSVFDGINDDRDHVGATIMGGVLEGISDREIQFSLQVVPEPASWCLLATGAIAIGAGARRRYRRLKH